MVIFPRSTDSRRAVVSYWGRNGHLVLPRNSVIRLNDLPDMTIDVYHGRIAKIQQQHYVKLYDYMLHFT